MHRHFRESGVRACLFRTSHEKNARFGTIRRVGSNSKDGNVNFGRDFERDQARRRVLITRNLTELVRLNLDLVPIKGPRQANWRRVHPSRTGSLTLISTSETISRGSLHRPLSPRQLDLRTLRAIVLFLALSRVPTVPGESASSPGIDDVYGRTPVIGWSRFIDGRISRLERALRSTRCSARHSGREPDFRRISEDVATAFSEFPFTRYRSVRICRHAPVSITIVFLENFLNLPHNKISIKYCTFTILKWMCHAYDTLGYFSGI